MTTKPRPLSATALRVLCLMNTPLLGSVPRLMSVMQIDAEGEESLYTGSYRVITTTTETPQFPWDSMGVAPVVAERLIREGYIKPFGVSGWSPTWEGRARKRELFYEITDKGREMVTTAQEGAYDAANG